MIKVFTVNGNGKIEFTKEELEKLLNDTYAEGQRNCNCGSNITWTNPSVTPYLPYYSDVTTSISTNNKVEPNNKEVENNKNSNTKSFTIGLNPEDAKRATQYINDITKRIAETNDVFSHLARELNF